ncbi:DeoR/GlpR family DNA-binding transcription regulator [Chitinimonas taiwanensis]|uniref:DeoR/GlpR family DNA-binding transcription regulator n=1 Tax=Chitinimonas taiwanensis TaxID=240412 RepID=UPI0035B152C4
MFLSERRQFILDALTRDGRVEVAQLAASLAISEDTVRRDLKALAEQGVLQKTHGGAVSLLSGQIAFPMRSQVRREVKTRIGELAATLVQPYQTVFIDAGSTATALARALTVQPLRVITNSLDVAQCLSEQAQIELIVTGGSWSTSERHLSGNAALATVARYRADLAFIGACAVHARLGVTATTAADAELKAAMLAHAAHGVLLSDASKFGQIAAHHVANLDAFHTLICEQPAEALGALPAGLQLLLAQPEAEPGRSGQA